MLAERVGDAVGVAGGGDHRVAGGQRRPGDVDAQAASCAGDEPDLLVSHAVCTSFVADPSVSLALVGVTSTEPAGCGRVGVPVERVHRQGPPAGRPLVEWTHGSRRSPRPRVTSGPRSGSSSHPAGPDHPRAGRAARLGGGRRRVPGLRRIEVAMPGRGMREYYVRLERGNAAGVSESVIDGIARALQLDAAERATCSTWSAPPAPSTARTAPRPHRRESGPPSSTCSTPCRQRRRSSSTAPRHPRRATRSGSAVLALLRHRRRRSNNARHVFLDPRATKFFRDWDTVANDTVALLRAEAGRDPYDRQPLRPDRRAVHPQRGLPASAGPPTTSASTPPASSASTTRSSATSTCPTSPSRSTPTPARACSPTPPSPARPTQTRSTLLASWAASEGGPALPRPANQARP